MCCRLGRGAVIRDGLSRGNRSLRRRISRILTGARSHWSLMGTSRNCAHLFRPWRHCPLRFVAACPLRTTTARMLRRDGFKVRALANRLNMPRWCNHAVSGSPRPLLWMLPKRSQPESVLQPFLGVNFAGVNFGNAIRYLAAVHTYKIRRYIVFCLATE